MKQSTDGFKPFKIYGLENESINSNLNKEGEIIPVPSVDKPASRNTKIIWPQNQKIGKLYFSDLQFHGGSKKKLHPNPGYWSFLAAVLDFLVLTAMSCFFLMASSLVLHTQIRTIFPNLIHGYALIFLFLNVIYLICSRYFFAATLGESVCSLRLGQPMQRFKNKYLFQVIMRTSVVYLTGLIPLSLLSFLFKKDLAGEISKVKLYRL